MIDELLLTTGSDIPFPEAGITIHNPTIKEIGMIGEENFHPGLQFLNFSKDSLDVQGKKDLVGQKDFDIFMSIMLSKEKAQFKISTKMVLSLLFPEYKIKFTTNGIELSQDNGFQTSINRHNYDTFKSLLISMFELDGGGGSAKYAPQDGLAAKIAEKFKKRDALKAQKAGAENHKVSVFSRYMSILAVGEHKDLNSFNSYTVYQLNDEFKRFQMKTSYDIYVQAKMAGARDLEEVDNWMNDIHDHS